MMTSCLMVYFSNGGTTDRVARSIAAGLSDMGCRVDLFNIKDDKPRTLDGYEILGIGSPVYYYRPTFNILDYLKELPDLKDKAFFSFILYGTYSYDALHKMEHILYSKGARGLGSFQCFGEDYFLGYLKRGVLFSPNHPSERELIEASVFGRDVSNCYKANGPVKIEKQRGAPLIYAMERFFLNQWLTKNFYSRLFKVDRASCTSCGICMEECPVNNIADAKNGQPLWGNKCILCLACEYKCPENAISSPLNLPVFVPFMNYNVRQASADPEIENVRVKYSRDIIERI